MIELFDVLANLLNLSGFVLLLNFHEISDFIAYLKKEIDAMGKRMSGKYNAAWEFKFRPMLGVLLLILGNTIQLILSMIKLIK